MRFFSLKRLLALGLPLIFLLASPPALAAHYTPGVEGVMAATTPPPGFHWRMYNVFQYEDALMDNEGDEINVDFDLKVFANVNRLVWGSETRFLGANWGMDAVVPLVYGDLTINVKHTDIHLVKGDNFNLGDITLEPLWMTWRLPRWDISTGLAVVLPTGTWDADKVFNTGEGYWSGMLTLGATYYFDEDKTWTASVLTRTLLNGEQKHTEINPGADFVAEWGVGRSMMAGKSLQVRPGLAGYGFWQFTDDDGDQADKDARIRKYAIGPEVNFFWLPPTLFQANLRALYEFGAQSTAQGYQVVLTLTKSF